MEPPEHQAKDMTLALATVVPFAQIHFRKKKNLGTGMY